LFARCHEGSFRAAAHHRLLGVEPDLPWPELAELQQRYREVTMGFEQRVFAVEFQRRLYGESDFAPAARGEVGPALAELVGTLAADEPERISRFCARFLIHSAGPLAGEPFVLAPFQEAFVREFYRLTRIACSGRRARHATTRRLLRSQPPAFSLRWRS
jgi:hypothetical protein